MNLREILNNFNKEVAWREFRDRIVDAVLDYNEAIADEVENPGDSLNGLLPIYWQIVRAHNTYKWPIDLKFIRENPEAARKMLRDHNLAEKLDRLIELDTQWRKLSQKIEEQTEPANTLKTEIDTILSTISDLPGVNSHPSNSGYDVGIFLVGFRSLPIVLSLAEIQPRQEIYFIHSEETGTKCDEIANRIEEMLECPPNPLKPLISATDATALINRVRSANRCKIANPSDPVETFKEIKRIIDSLASDKKIALDLTGGKKTMIGGGFTAGSIYSLSPKCDMFYVDSSEYDSYQGAPKPGTEFLSQLDNPYNVYNVQSIREAEALFDGHNYEAAASLWDTANEKLNTYAKQYGLQHEQATVQKNLYMANCYRSWDAFDYSEAQRHKNDNGNLWSYHTKHIHNIHNDVLNILVEVNDKQTLFADEKRVIHFAVDRYQNAIRRKNSDKLEDAILRFTQVVEILCNYKIRQIAQGGDLLNENGSVITTPNTQWRNFKLIPFLFGADPSRYERNGGRYFQFRRGANVCLELEDYPDFNDIGEIMVLIERRNDFVHFNRPIADEAEETAEKLKNLAYQFLLNFSTTYLQRMRLNFCRLLELHEFRLS